MNYEHSESLLIYIYGTSVHDKPLVFYQDHRSHSKSLYTVCMDYDLLGYKKALFLLILLALRPRWMGSQRTPGLGEITLMCVWPFPNLLNQVKQNLCAHLQRPSAHFKNEIQ